MIKLNMKLFRKDLRAFKNYLKRVKDFTSGQDANLNKTLDRIGKYNVINSQSRLYKYKTQPDAQPFAPLSLQYYKWKVKHHGSDDIGILSGKMARSIQHTIDDVTNGKEITTGTTARTQSGFPYPYVFQHGSVKQKPRPFLGYSDKEIDFAKSVIVNALKNL